MSKTKVNLLNDAEFRAWQLVSEDIYLPSAVAIACREAKVAGAVVDFEFYQEVYDTTFELSATGLW